ncbi:MAG: hypothetical protein AAGI34_09175 [Pseudomonadota bacterium]
MTDIADQPGPGAALARRPLSGLATTPKLALPVALFVLSMLCPLIIDIGALRMSPYRLVLLVMVLPCFFAVFSGRAGRVRPADYAMLFLYIWSVIAIVFHHGLLSQIEALGIFFVETIGAYMLGRLYIRDAASFLALVRLLFITVMIMLPVAIVEAVTGRNIIISLFEMIGRSYREANMEQRLGFDRAQGAFQHPILFGVYCGGVIALAYFVLGYGKSFIGAAGRAGTVLLGALCCFSSGPMTAMVAQLGIIGWNVVFKSIPNRWWMLTGFAAFAWVFVDIFSNRTPPEVFIHYFALNSGTAFNRILIWEYGSKSVMSHPLLGLGFNDWPRPGWMSGSMDMYWLVVPVRYGLPAGLAMGFVFLWIFLKVALRKGLDARLNAYRLGYLGCMLGYFMVGWTVHFWNETYVVFMMIIGAGVWFLDADTQQSEAAPEEPARRPVRGLRPAARLSDGDEPTKPAPDPAAVADDAAPPAPPPLNRARNSARGALSVRDRAERRPGGANGFHGGGGKHPF